MPTPPEGSTALAQISHSQGGKGQALRYITQFSSDTAPTLLGKSPGPGTNCTAYLLTNSDAAYLGAQVSFYVEQFGKIAFFSQQEIFNTDLEQGAIAFTAGSCAADAWYVFVTLAGVGLPAQALTSSVGAFGVENTGGAGGAGKTYTGDAPIIVSGTVISIDPAFIPWEQVGGVGGTIEAIDETASLQAVGGLALGFTSIALGPNSIAFGQNTVAIAGGQATVPGDVAIAGGYANGGTAVGVAQGTAYGSPSFAACNAAALLANDVAFGALSSAGGGNSFAAAGGNAQAPNDVSFNSFSVSSGTDSFSATGGFAIGNYSVALQGTANGLASMALGGLLGGSVANGDYSVAIGDATATNNNAVVLGNQNQGAGFAGVAIGDDALGESLAFFGTTLGFFGTTPATQQIGGPATAGAVYTAVEQGMLNALYTAAQAYGLLT